MGKVFGCVFAIVLNACSAQIERKMYLIAVTLLQPFDIAEQCKTWRHHNANIQVLVL